MKFKILKSGKFYWMPQRCGAKQSMATMRYNSEIHGYDGQHYWVTTCVRWFFMWWIFVIDMEPDPKGMGKSQYIEHSGPLVAFDNSNSFRGYLTDRGIAWRGTGHGTEIDLPPAAFARLGYEYAQWAIKQLRLATT